MRIEKRPLAKGQLWRMANKHLEIVELGKRLTHYRLLTRVDQRGAPLRLGGAAEVEAYLEAHQAKLVTAEDVTPEPAAISPAQPTPRTPKRAAKSTKSPKAKKP